MDFHLALEGASASGVVMLHWGDGQGSPAVMSPRGGVGLGWWPWSLPALALLVVLIGSVVALGRPHAGNLLYLSISLCQAASLLYFAAATAHGLGLPSLIVRTDLPVRGALDLLSAGAALHALMLYAECGDRAAAALAGAHRQPVSGGAVARAVPDALTPGRARVRAAGRHQHRGGVAGRAFHHRPFAHPGCLIDGGGVHRVGAVCRGAPVAL